MPFSISQPFDELNGEAVADVIFVHGLTGESSASWTHSNGFDWIKELASDLPEFNIISVDYYSAIRRNEIDLSLVRIAETLATTLLLRGIGKRPLFFICHSLGGLIAKAILRHSQQLPGDNGNLAANCLGIVFLAVPHRGSRMAD